MEKNGKTNPLDDFWDLSDLIPKREKNATYRRTAEPTDIRLDGVQTNSPREGKSSDTVIVRYIQPSREETQLRTYDYERSETYAPAASLIHEVTLRKRKSDYRFYQEFLEDAIRFLHQKGSECGYEPFFSYVPQYNQLSEKQLSYYLWFRECFLRGERIRIDYSYVLLWIYERINLGSLAEVADSQAILTKLWYAYHEEFPALSSKLAEWICDFSLVHRLPPPKEADDGLFRRVPSLKEFYLTMPDDDVEGCVRSLLQYCSSYDYRTSKFATEENLPLFDQYVSRALGKAVLFYSRNGKILSELSIEDSCLSRDAYAGALCVAEERYRIEVRYCSFSRSNELRFLVGDVVKYTENKIRAYLGIKSRMTVYSIPTELQRILDEYFSLNLSGRRTVTPKREPKAYEKLYEIPQSPLSLSAAAKIERDSWETTEKLVSAFEEEPTLESEPSLLPEEPMEPSKREEADPKNELQSQLGEYWEDICELCRGNVRAIYALSVKTGKMTDALVDHINEIAFEVYGDSLLEETDGGYSVIEDYRKYVVE